MTSLTQRQIEILKRIATGETIKSIASDLAVSPKTIEFHWGELKRKLGIQSHVEATHYAIVKLGVPLMFAIVMLGLTGFSQVPVPAAAAPEYPGITLAWDAPADTNVAGFWVYWGVKSRTYTNSILVGTNRTMTFTTLLPSVLYYFAATSTDKTGIQSDFSTEASGMMQTNFPPTTNAIAYLWIEASPRPTGPFTNANLFTKTLTNATQAALYYRLMGAK